MKMHLTLAPLVLVVFTGCVTSDHPTRPSTLGEARSSSDLLAVIDQPGPLQVETIASADWQVERSGLINLQHDKAKNAKLEDGPEPIQLFFHVVRHPTHGTFIIDTGVERALAHDPSKSAVQGLVANAMKMEHLKVHTALGDWLEKEPAPLSGVMLSHLHLDHILGTPDLPNDVPVYAGPGEAEARAFMNLFANGTTDAVLKGKGPLNTWQFSEDPDGRFAGVLDVFGDGTFWALWVPGHTPGSTAYLARTAEGSVLFVGDTCHTAWGWENEVEPGTFTADQEQNAEALLKLRRLVAEHPTITVRLGHQHR